MLVMYQNGSTLAEVGKEFGLSRQRIYQILMGQECKMRRSGPRTWVQP
jgi:DNA-directed RNA polymerase sigma subunit (sigma70/sigma32)